MTLLSGIRVLDLSLQLPGPFCTMMMADYGADVVKIDEPEPRVRNPFATEDPGMGPLDRYLNRGKKSVTLNLKSPEGRDIFRKLAAGRRRRGRRFPPGGGEAPRCGVRNAVGGEPGAGVLLDLRLRSDGADARRRGPRRELPLLRRGPGPFRAPGGAAHAAPRPGGGCLRRVDDGALRDPDGAAFPAADREGGVDRHLDD